MQQDRRSLLDYSPVQPQKNAHAPASENQHFKPNEHIATPQNKRGFKNLVGGISARQKQRAKAKADDAKLDDIADKNSDHTGASTPVREQNTDKGSEQREYYLDPDKPLLDFVAIFMAVWHRKYLIVLIAFIAGVIGAIIALATPHTYYAESQIFFDPRELRVTDRDLGNNPASSQLLLALVDTQMRVATSKPVLENTIAELGLTNDPEFNGKDTGVSGAIGSLVSSSPEANESLNKRVLDRLRKSIGVDRDPKTLVVSLGVTTKNPEKSALIANTLVKQFLLDFGTQKSDFFNQTSSSIQTRLDVLSAKLDEAENAIVQYRAKNDIIDVGGGVIVEKEMLSLSDSLTKVRAEQIAKSILAEELSKVDINAVISGSFPQAALTSTLSELRGQYSVAKSSIDSLAVGLGPRHPTLVAAQASTKVLEADIRDELRRIVAAAQRDAKRSQQAEAELSSQLAVLKTQASSKSVENIELEELTRKASSLRVLYEQLLRSSGETALMSELVISKIKIISEAEAPDKPSSTSRKITTIFFAIAGGMLGLAYAMSIGAWSGIQRNFLVRPSASTPQDMPQSKSQTTPDDQDLNIQSSAPIPRQARQRPIQQTQQQAQKQTQQRPQQFAQQRYPQRHHYSGSQDPLPQAGFGTNQTAAAFPNVAPYAAESQHVSLKHTDQRIYQPITQPTEPDVSEDIYPTHTPVTNHATHELHGHDSDEYQRLHNEVQRVRSKLEDWVNQNNGYNNNR